MQSQIKIDEVEVPSFMDGLDQDQDVWITFERYADGTERALAVELEAEYAAEALPGYRFMAAATTRALALGFGLYMSGAKCTCGMCSKPLAYDAKKMSLGEAKLYAKAGAANGVAVFSSPDYEGVAPIYHYLE